MIKTSERNLSFTLAVMSLLVFILTIVGVFTTSAMLSILWNVVFVICWVLMLVFALVVLFDKNAYKFSVFAAVVTGIAFLALAIHALMILSKFIPQLPDRLIVPNMFLVEYNQLIFYTALIIVYFVHFINFYKLNPARGKNDLSDKGKVEVKKEKKKKQISEEDRAILNSHLVDDEKSLFETDND